MGILGYINLIAYSVVSAFELILVIYCVSSWIIRDPFNKFMQTLRVIINPVVEPVRSILSRFAFFRKSPIDFSVLIVFILCSILISLLR